MTTPTRPADAQRLRQALAPAAATDAELLSQLRLQEVRSHLRQQYRTRPGSPLTAADHALLRLAAAPGTCAGHQACQLLQVYEPACACAQALNARPAPATPRPQAAEAAPLLGEGHPNPATEQVRFAYHLPAGTQAAQLVVYDVLGRRLATQPVEARASELTLAVQMLPTGLYLVVLEVDGRPLATRKISVTH